MARLEVIERSLLLAERHASCTIVYRTDFGIFGEKSAVTGLSSQSNLRMLHCMERGNPSCGMKKCRKFTALVNSFNTMQVVSAALTGHYCVLNHKRNKFGDFRSGSLVITRGTMKRHFVTAFVAISALLAASHHGAAAKPRPTSYRTSQQIPPSTEQAAWVGEKGMASYYGNQYHGRRTSSGTRFDQRELTAAHSWLPFGTKVRVTLPATGHSVVVTITDRLYSARRIVDLSLTAARRLGMVRQGVAEVSLQPV